MFEAVLNGEAGRSRPLGAAAAISVLIHLLALALIAWASARTPIGGNGTQMAITFMAAPRAAAPPIGSPTGSLAGKAIAVHEHAPTRKRVALRQPTKTVAQRPLDPKPDPDDSSGAVKESTQGAEGGIAGAMAGGVRGGVPGGTVGGGLAGSLRIEVLPFGQGMTRPTRVDGQDPVYTREALEARIEGLTIVKCVITAEGKAENCRMIKALPHMERAVLDALATQKFKPVTFQGRPVSVDYVFNIRLVLPRH